MSEAEKYSWRYLIFICYCYFKGIGDEEKSRIIKLATEHRLSAIKVTRRFLKDDRNISRLENELMGDALK